MPIASTASIPPQVVDGFVRLCHLEQIAPGLGRAFRIGDRSVAVFRQTSGECSTVLAVDNRCPHKGGPLADGMIAGGNVVCPMHAYKYNLATGACDQPHACPVQTHETRLIDGFVYVRAPERS